MHKKFGKDRASGSGYILVDRQTDRQTDRHRCTHHFATAPAGEENLTNYNTLLTTY